MEDIEIAGKKIDQIPVKISYRIIELFSAGLYSSPNKAFEELVCNSYDAFADRVAVFVAPDLSVENARIWICDNGESMDQEGLKDLWKIGESKKRSDPQQDKKRLQIGQFGIGKLATYILAERLTYICKKYGRFLVVTMNYAQIRNDKDILVLDEREITENEAEKLLAPLITVNTKKQIPFELFGTTAEKTWTFSILSGLKPKTLEIKEGRLKWVLKTALPLNPSFRLFYNGVEISSSKENRPILKKWVLGQNDLTIQNTGFAVEKEENGKHYIDFTNLKNVYGEIELYEDSLVDASKSAELGRSHGIFLLVRDRLVNLDDPLLGMDAFSHGAFNRTRMIVHADELDTNLTSTRESIKESAPFNQLKEYLKRKFNNEVKKFFFDNEQEKERQQNVSARLLNTSLTISKRPLYVFAQKYYNNEIKNPLLICISENVNKNDLLESLKQELQTEESIIKDVKWEIMQSSDPIAKLELHTGILRINLLHPFIANYFETFVNKLPLQFFAITEVLTEAHLYELGIDEGYINNIIRRRDITLRELSLSNRVGAPIVAQILKDALADPTGLENAVCDSLTTLGFETSHIGGNGKPDGIAYAKLGYSAEDRNENYSLIFDAKSTSKDKIQANTAHLATINKHKKDYNADYAVVVTIDIDGSNDPLSTISITAKQQKITIIRAVDLIRLLLLSTPKQVGLKKLRDLFDTCYSPIQVSQWIDKIQNEEIKIAHAKELFEVIYELQSKDTEPPELAGIRQKLIEKLKNNTPSKSELKDLINSFKVFVPGFISIEGEKIGIQAPPERILSTVKTAIHNDIPTEMQQIYLQAFSDSII